MTREEAMERIEFRVRRFCPEANGDNIGECNGCWRYPCNDMKALLVLRDLIEKERPHGEWKHMTVCGVEFINCSNCGCGCPLYSYVKKDEKEEKVQHCETDFCPNCGADMRKKASEDDE